MSDRSRRIETEIAEARAHLSACFTYGMNACLTGKSVTNNPGKDGLSQQAWRDGWNAMNSFLTGPAARIVVSPLT